MAKTKQAGSDCYNVGFARDKRGRLKIRFAHRLGPEKKTSDGVVQDWVDAAPSKVKKLLTELVNEMK